MAHSVFPPVTTNLIVVAATLSASPTIWDGSGNTVARQIGYHFGAFNGSAQVDGLNHGASQGADNPFILM